MRCVLGETLDRPAPDVVRGQLSALCLAGSGGRRLRRVCDSEVVEGSLGLKGEEVKFVSKWKAQIGMNHAGAVVPICPVERSSTVLAGTKPPRERIYPLMRLMSETCYFAGDFGGISA